MDDQNPPVRVEEKSIDVAAGNADSGDAMITESTSTPTEVDGKNKVDGDSNGAAGVTKPPVLPAGISAASEQKAPDNAEARPWDTTNRKVTVFNIMKFLDARKVKKLTESWLTDMKKDHPTMAFGKIKKPPKDNWISITLESEDMVSPFLNYFNTNNLTNKKGGIITAKRSSDEQKSNKRPADDRDIRGGKRARSSDDSQHRQPKDPRDVITPLWKQSYEQQLVGKGRDMIKLSCMKIVKEIKDRFRIIQREAKRNPNRSVVKEFDWLKQSKPIEVEKIMAAPSYQRNKCEFTFGFSAKPASVVTPQKDDKIEVAESTPDIAAATAATTTTASTGDETPAATNNTASTPANDAAPTDPTNDDNAASVAQVPALGLMASGWAGGVTRPHICQNIPDEACAVVDIVDEFLKTSPMPPYDSKVHRGFWRFLTVRTSVRTGQCMIVVVHAPATGGAGAKDDSDDYSKVFASEKDRLVSMLTESHLTLKEKRVFEVDATFKPQLNPKYKEDNPVNVTSIFFQEFDGLSNPKPEHPVQHVFGKLALEEKLGDCTFQVSPGAFFQVVTAGAENLYGIVVEKVREMSKDPQETLLFDVCCGTGTIGLTCMKAGVCGRVVGVDISVPAIEDAKLNAKLNGYPAEDNSQTRFVASRAEHVMAEEIQTAERTTKTIIAVVDPAREGLHPDVARSLRLSKAIDRIVYVSCNPTGSLVKDAGLLCAPPTNRYGGVPFRPTSAQPVDMFPLTKHCEMVMTFDRMPQDETPEPEPAKTS